MASTRLLRIHSRPDKPNWFVQAGGGMPDRVRVLVDAQRSGDIPWDMNGLSRSSRSNDSKVSWDVQLTAHADLHVPAR